MRLLPEDEAELVHRLRQVEARPSGAVAAGARPRARSRPRTAASAVTSRSARTRARRRARRHAASGTGPPRLQRRRLVARGRQVARVTPRAVDRDDHAVARGRRPDRRAARRSLRGPRRRAPGARPPAALRIERAGTAQALHAGDVRPRRAARAGRSTEPAARTTSERGQRRRQEPRGAGSRKAPARRRAPRERRDTRPAGARARIASLETAQVVQALAQLRARRQRVGDRLPLARRQLAQQVALELPGADHVLVVGRHSASGSSDGAAVRSPRATRAARAAACGRPRRTSRTRARPRSSVMPSTWCRTAIVRVDSGMAAEAGGRAAAARPGRSRAAIVAGPRRPAVLGRAPAVAQPVEAQVRGHAEDQADGYWPCEPARGPSADARTPPVRRPRPRRRSRRRLPAAADHERPVLPIDGLDVEGGVDHSSLVTPGMRVTRRVHPAVACSGAQLSRSSRAPPAATRS